jgi:hypothetical protein
MYEHRQPGWLLLGMIGGAAALFLIVASQEPHITWPLILPLAVLAICAYLFSGLTVRVDRTSVSARFGPGLIRKTISLSDIASCAPVRNRWWYGWGIRKIPHGWLYNVSGLDAVELKMENGRVYRIGTDEPRALASAISQNLRCHTSGAASSRRSVGNAG